MAKKICPNGHSYDENLSECPFCRQPGLVNVSEAKKGTVKIKQPTEEEKIEKPPSKDVRPAPEPKKDKTQVLGEKQLQSDERLARVEQRKLVGMLATYDIEENGHLFAIYQGKNIIGRDQYCDIVIPDSYVSKEHALILYRDEKFFLVDSASSNGTYLNEQALNPHAPAELKDGDIIFITKKYKFYFRTCISPAHSEKSE